MGNILGTILYFAVMIGVIILILIGGRKYLFSKVRVNKWILLAISLGLLVGQFFIKIQNPWLSMILTIIIVTLFLWFMDIQSTGGPKAQEKKIVIRPKAKPNRVKHLKKDENK